MYPYTTNSIRWCTRLMKFLVQAKLRCFNQTWSCSILWYRALKAPASILFVKRVLSADCGFLLIRLWDIKESVLSRFLVFLIRQFVINKLYFVLKFSFEANNWRFVMKSTLKNKKFQLASSSLCYSPLRHFCIFFWTLLHFSLSS